MAEEPTPIVYSNVLPWRGCEKLYMDTRTADVFFVFEFDDEDTVKVPAHKNILSANSEAFDAMFYGPRKQEGDIPIVDSSPGAFKEFLQFFYLGAVKLTNENATHVMNLGKQYLVDECCMTVSNFTEKTLTLDNMCVGYELAILFEQAQLMKFCEQKIGENPKEIFRTNSFLSCRSNLLARILQLDTFNCDESVVFDGCIAWAKAACVQKGLDGTNMQNLRNQLGDLFYEIRFGDMTTESFYPRYSVYEELFSMKEFKDIIGMIASKEYRPPKFNRNGRKTSQIYKYSNKELICNLFNETRYETCRKRMDLDTVHSVMFASNCEMLLKTIHCGKVFYYNGEEGEIASTVPTIIEIHELSNERPAPVGFSWDEKIIDSNQVIFQSQRETIIHLSTPYIIRPDFKYRIRINGRVSGRYYYSKLRWTEVIEMDQDVEIYIPYRHNREFGLVEKMVFIKPVKNDF